MSPSRPDDAGAARSGGGQPFSNKPWVTLEDAAVALRISRQTLWQRMQELQLVVRRIHVGGRQVSGLSSADLERLAAPDATHATNGGGTDHALFAGLQPVAKGDGNGHAEPLSDADGAQRSLWQRLREFELQRDQLDFELRVVRTQLGDTRGRAQQAEENSRTLRGDLDAARTELAAARSESERWRAQCEALGAEHAAAQSIRAAERERLTTMERQMERLIDIEKSRERYCDRLEQRLRGLGAA